MDWKNEQWTSLGRVCGRETPKPFNSTGNKMRVLFRSNDKINGRGFKAKWTTSCGGTFIADKQQRRIVSPGYPNEYKNNMVCVYTIVAPNQNINIQFEDFALEKGKYS